MNEAFFRRCWLTLKATNPRLRKRMTEIECGLEGIRVREREPSPKKSEEDNVRRTTEEKSKEIIPI